MTVLITTEGAPASGAAVVAVEGQVDVYNAVELREALLAALGGGEPRVVLDLSGLRFLDSTGIGILAGACKRAMTTGKCIEAVGMSPRIERVLAMAGVDRLLAEVAPDPS